MSSSSVAYSPPVMSNDESKTEPLPPSSTRNPSNSNLNNLNNLNNQSSTIESTYTSLIQQYLSLLQYENAIFLAERFVAYNSTPYSNYLLAMCYYKNHKIQYAKRILLNWNQRNLDGGDVGGGRRGGRNTGNGSSTGSSTHNQYFYSSSRQKQLHFENEFNMAMDNESNNDQNHQTTTTNNNSNNNNNNNNSVVDDNIIYLLAKCNIDLELWKEAEDALLKNARTQYQNYKKKLKELRNKEKKKDANNNGNNTSSKVDDTVVMANTLEEYLFELVSRKNNMNTDSNVQESKSTLSSLSSSLFDDSCLPIPNGAAGLHLLGIVCQRTMRKDKASLYYTLALKLDPMMWTSYEALCEMGTAAINNNNTYNSKYMNNSTSHFKPDLDPIHIFGVIPSNLYNIPKSQGGYGPEHSIHNHRDDTTIHMNVNNDNDPTTHHSTTENQEFLKRIREVGGESQSPFHIVNASPIMTTTEEEGGGIGVVGTDFHPTNHSLHHRQNHHHHHNQTSSSSSFVPQTPYVRNNKIHHVDSAIHAASLFPQSAMSATNVGGGGGTGNGTAESGRNTSSHLPPTTLFATPGLTPIPYNPTSVSSTTSQQPVYPSSSLYSYTKNEQVFSRAKQVASRLYYEPSPELTPPPYYNNHHRHHTSSTMKSKIRLTDEFTNASTTTATTNDNDNNNNNTTPTSPRYSTNATKAANLSSALKMSRRKQYKRRTDFSLLAVEESKQENGKTEQQRLLFDGVANSTNNVGGNSDEDMMEEEGLDEEEEVNLSDEVEKIEEESKHRRNGGDNDENIDPQENGIGEEGIQHILELFCTLGAAQRMLCSYRCKEALQIFRSLPNSQYNTGFVQHQVGRAFFEISDYSSSQNALETMQRVEPYRMKGLDLLSTVFWQLKKEVELSSLAQRAVDFDKMAPQSWCVVGNCFSLQKEHETALVFFRRSIQLDPSFTYSHTLSGHEYVSNEDFEQATSCFRNAIRIDERHYTAWYGLGDIYYRQEKYDLAEYHFKKALSINPQSSVLHCHLGMAQHANGKDQEALDTLACAFKVDPRNPQARFQRAQILMSIDKPNEALKEFEKVRDEAPTEATVHFNMGKVLKRLDRKEEAMRCFLTALDLDPKDNNQIKAAIDRLDDPDMLEEDVSAF